MHSASVIKCFGGCSSFICLCLWGRQPCKTSVYIGKLRLRGGLVICSILMVQKRSYDIMNPGHLSSDPALWTIALNFLPWNWSLCWKPRYLSYQVFFKLHCIYFYFSYNLCNHPLIELQLTVCVWEVADNISAVCALAHACQLFWHNIYLSHKS